MIAGGVVTALAPLASLVALLALVAMMLSPSSVAYPATEQNADAFQVAAQETGIDDNAASMITEASDDTGVPWEVLAAIIDVEGNQADSTEQKPVSDKEIQADIAANKAIGPYSLLAGDLDKQVYFSDEKIPSPAPKDVLTLNDSGRPTHQAYIASFDDLQTSSEAVGSLLFQWLSYEAPATMDTFDLGAGVGYATVGQDNTIGASPGTQQIVYDDQPTADPSESDSTLPFDPSEPGNAVSQQLRSLYIAALSQLPIDGMSKDKARQIYDTAMAWYMGQSSQCVTNDAPTQQPSPSATESTAPGASDSATPTASGSAAPTGTSSIDPSSLGLANEIQVENAQLIVQVGAANGGTAAEVIGVMTAYTESGLETDPGSLGGAYGLFQQTPPGWGTQQQVMDPTYATNKFFSALSAVPNWQQLEPWQAAQAVQKSGAGAASDGASNYEPNLALAQTIVDALGGGASATVTGTCGGAANQGATFSIGNMNVLGPSHTACGAPSSTCQHPSWPTWDKRYATEADAINASGISMVALQEMQSNVLGTYKADLGSKWHWWGQGGDQDLLAFDSTIWKGSATDRGYFAIPFYNGNHEDAPWMLLTNRTTGQQVIFMSVHVPSPVYRAGGSTALTDRAEAALADYWKKTLVLAHQGVPIVLSGDMNNKSFPTYFIPLAGSVDSSGATVKAGTCSGCSTNKDGDIWMESTTDVSWTHYKDEGKVTFDGLNLGGPYSNPTPSATDHYFVTATASVAGGVANGVGEFSPSTQVVGQYSAAALLTRAKKYAAATSGWTDTGVGGATYSTAVDYTEGPCQHFVANLSGYSNSDAPNRAWAIDKWNQYIADGLAHPASTAAGMSPPIGAELYYDTHPDQDINDNPQHVVIYLGNNTVISTDMGSDGGYDPDHISIVPEKDVAAWGPYLGWAPPTF